MIKAPTLADLVVRSTFSGHVDAMWRGAVLNARKFVLDEGMSAFLSDLSHAAFVDSSEKAIKAIDGARTLSRAPYSITWIEYDARAERRRTLQAYRGNTAVIGYDGLQTGGLSPPEEVPPRIGYLLVEDKEIRTTFRVVTFIDAVGRAEVLPTIWGWETTDARPPWGMLSHPQTKGDLEISELATGILGYKSKQIALLTNLDSDGAHGPENQRIVGGLLREHAGSLRRLMVLLSTINDLPVLGEAVKPSRGYFARGRYRTFLEHSIIHLRVPARKTIRSLAEHVITMSRRRAHQVRGHWRTYERGKDPCRHHDWDENLECRACGAWMTWIAEHQRGDASIGFVTHDYAVGRGRLP